MNQGSKESTAMDSLTASELFAKAMPEGIAMARMAGACQCKISTVSAYRQWVHQRRLFQPLMVDNAIHGLRMASKGSSGQEGNINGKSYRRTMPLHFHFANDIIDIINFATVFCLFEHFLKIYSFSRSLLS